MSAAVTHFPRERAETVRTDKTDTIGNDDFLQAVFGDCGRDTRPVVVSFGGNPTTAPQSA